MVEYEKVIDFIEGRNKLVPRTRFLEKSFYVPVEDKIILQEDQKLFIKNLVEGKITDVPRNFGKTFLILLYAEYLDYLHDNVKYSNEIKADDYISCHCLIQRGMDKKFIVRALRTNGEAAIRDYNINLDVALDLLLEEYEEDKN